VGLTGPGVDQAELGRVADVGFRHDRRVAVRVRGQAQRLVLAASLLVGVLASVELGVTFEAVEERFASQVDALGPGPVCGRGRVALGERIQRAVDGLDLVVVEDADLAVVGPVGVDDHRVGSGRVLGAVGLQPRGALGFDHDGAEEAMLGLEARVGVAVQEVGTFHGGIVGDHDAVGARLAGRGDAGLVLAERHALTGGRLRVVHVHAHGVGQLVLDGDLDAVADVGPQHERLHQFAGLEGLGPRHVLGGVGLREVEPGLGEVCRVLERSRHRVVPGRDQPRGHLVDQLVLLLGGHE